MPTEKKKNQVKELENLFRDNKFFISTEYKNISANQMTSLRKVLNSSGSSFRIIKNNLAFLAAENSGKIDLKDIINGPCGIVVSKGDPAETSRALIDEVKNQKLSMKIIGALMDEEILDSQNIAKLASLPNKDILMANLLGQMFSPVSGLAYVLSAQLRSFATVIKNISKAKAESEPEAKEEVKAESKELEPEAKEEVKVESKELEPEAKEEVKVESKESEPEAKEEVKVESKESEPEVKENNK